MVDTTTFKGFRVVTNKHIVELILANGRKLSAKKVLIKLNLPNINEREYWEAEITGLNDEYDIAVLFSAAV